MNLQRKLTVIPFQERAYIEGIIECIGDYDWLFFDEVNEEAFDLSALGPELEILLNGSWVKGTLIENTLLYIDNDFHYLTSGDHIRYKKNLAYSFKQIIAELLEPSFLHFVKTLNTWSYSLYDCIYCHNFLEFLQEREEKEGMNVIVFDNGDKICVVQHFFLRNNHEVRDRFEFTQSDGKRMISSFIP